MAECRAFFEELTSQYKGVMLNPTQRDASLWNTALQNNFLANHIWFLTSGSSGEQKGVALSYEAMLASAEAVNRHFEVNHRDVLLRVLPLFHVGGFSVHVRSYLANCEIVQTDAKWHPEEFVNLCERNKVTVVSRVPTQVFDLVVQSLPSPKTLRAVIVGGGSLNSNLAKQAYQLGWPIYSSYGLTEFSSQVATACRPCGPLHVLSHCEVRVREKIEISGHSLLTKYCFLDGGRGRLCDPKEQGWFVTEDLGDYREGELTVFGRGSDWVKIKGEGVSLAKLRSRLRELELKFGYLGEILAVPHPRDGHQLVLVTLPEIKIKMGSFDSLVETFHQSLSKIEQLTAVVVVPAFPKSELGKILFAELESLVCTQLCTKSHLVHHLT